MASQLLNCDTNHLPAISSAYVREQPLRTNRNDARRNVLIIGSDTVSRSLAAYFRQHPRAGFSVCGFVDDAEVAGGDVLGKVENLSRIALAGFVDEVILTGHCERDLAR